MAAAIRNGLAAEGEQNTTSIYSLIEDRTPISYDPWRIGVLSREDDLPYMRAVIDRHKHAGFGFDVEGRTK